MVLVTSLEIVVLIFIVFIPERNTLILPRTRKMTGMDIVYRPHWKDNGFDFTDDEMTKFKIWKDAIVPYYIDSLSFDKGLCDKIRVFLEDIASLTSLRFDELSVPPKYGDKTRWVIFINRIGLLECLDYTTTNFTNDGVQRVILGYDCIGTGTAMAATILALAGVPPQHNAPDRDSYIRILKDNILPEKLELFKSLPDQEWLFHDLSYDFKSVTHYNLFKYSKNGYATIKPKKHVKGAIGESEVLSWIDISKVNMLYKYIRYQSIMSKKKKYCSKHFRLSNFTGSDYEEVDDDDEVPMLRPEKYLLSLLIKEYNVTLNDAIKLKEEVNEIGKESETDEETVENIDISEENL